MSLERVETSVACPACGCVCDDLTVRFGAEAAPDISPRCALGETWFASQSQGTRPVAAIGGIACELGAAMERAAEVLRNSHYPLVFLGPGGALPGWREAIALAEKLGGALDTSASLTHGAAIMAMQEFGEAGCTLGEIRNRADLVIFWGCSPARSHPRHAERYSASARAKHLAGDRAHRTVVMIGPSGEVEHWRLDASGTKPDLTVAIEPGSDFAVISQLRALLRGETISVPEPVRALFDLIQVCGTGAVFHDLGAPGLERSGHVAVGALLQLAAELNSRGRFYVRRLGSHGDAPGPEAVMTWQTGYPFAVDFSRGHARHNPGEFSANGLLERREVDAVLMLGSSSAALMSEEARDWLGRIPVIAIDSPGTARAFEGAVNFTVAAYGLHAAGLVWRMDGVPVLLRALVAGEWPLDAEVLLGVRERV